MNECIFRNQLASVACCVCVDFNSMGTFLNCVPCAETFVCKVYTSIGHVNKVWETLIYMHFVGASLRLSIRMNGEMANITIENTALVCNVDQTGRAIMVRYVFDVTVKNVHDIVSHKSCNSQSLRF